MQVWTFLIKCLAFLRYRVQAKWSVVLSNLTAVAVQRLLNIVAGEAFGSKIINILR